jgi:hypothetical protein
VVVRCGMRPRCGNSLRTGIGSLAGHPLRRRQPADVTPGLGERPDPVGTELAAQTRLSDAAERHARILGCLCVAVNLPWLGSRKDSVRIPECLIEFEAKKSSRRVGGT